MEQLIACIQSVASEAAVIRQGQESLFLLEPDKDKEKSEKCRLYWL